MKKYRHLYFDLDRTLWDYEQNSSGALAEIYETYALKKIFETSENFKSAFTKHNDALWKDYSEGKVHKEILRTLRFELAMKDFGTNDADLACRLNADFVQISPRKTGLVPGAIELLNYLIVKHYKLYIITNGFTQMQEMKMEASGLVGYFNKVFTSENVGSNKPNRAMFEYAVKSVNARKRESLMIGDDLEIDIAGARKFGMDQVFFNPSKIIHNQSATYEIYSLPELMGIL
jgi:putative hydrolase of the HAD superfamily